MTNKPIGIIGAMQVEIEGLKAAMTDVKTETVSGVTFTVGKLEVLITRISFLMGKRKYLFFISTRKTDCAYT